MEAGPGLTSSNANEPLGAVIHSTGVADVHGHAWHSNVGTAVEHGSTGLLIKHSQAH